MQVLVALLAYLGLSSGFLLPSTVRPPARHASKEPIVDIGGQGVYLRPAQQDEKRFVQQTLLGMLMNPLSIDMQNFLCAEELETGSLVGFGQIRPIGGSNFELASLHVAESHRQRGLGSCLVRQLIKGFVSERGSEQLQRLYLLTLASTAKFYEKNGFAVVPPNEVPVVLKAERAIGSVVVSFSGNGDSLVCMQASKYSVEPLR